MPSLANGNERKHPSPRALDIQRKPIRPLTARKDGRRETLLVRMCDIEARTSMAKPDTLAIDTRVMAPVGDVLHRGVIAKPRPGQSLDEGTVFVRFTPPVPAAEPFNAIDFVTCPVSRVTLGWF
jgi:hypothetical protein